MDRLLIADVKELNLTFNNIKPHPHQQHKTTPTTTTSTTFRLTNLMHTMPVAVSLTTTNPTLFSFNNSLSILPPLSTSSFTLFILSTPNNQLQQPPFANPNDSVTVRSTMLPIGKANVDDLRRLFSRGGLHIFKDAVLPISFVGPTVVEFLLSSSSDNRGEKTIVSYLRLTKAISGCSRTELTSLIMPAIECGNEDCVRELIDAGADVTTLESSSFLSVAVWCGNVEIVRLLIASGCTVSSNSPDLVLHEAAAKNKVDLMRILCAELDALDVNSVDATSRTAMHVAAICGHVESLRFLVSIGGNPDYVDLNQWSPLHFAASQGHDKAVEYLLNCSWFVKYALTDEKKTPFQLAVDNGHTSLYNLLQLDDVLNKASASEDVSEVKKIVSDGANVNNRDHNGWTPLHRAAFKGRIENVKILISNGAQVNVVDDFGYTPLHCAVEAGHMEISSFLLSSGANANLQSLKGLIPFNNGKNVEFMKSTFPKLVRKFDLRNSENVNIFLF